MQQYCKYMKSFDSRFLFHDFLSFVHVLRNMSTVNQVSLRGDFILALARTGGDHRSGDQADRKYHFLR